MEQCFDCGDTKETGKDYYRAWCSGCQKVSQFGTLDSSIEYEYATIEVDLDNWLYDGDTLNKNRRSNLTSQSGW